MAKKALGTSKSRLPASLYAETARERALTPALEGDKRVHVAIVGGGFTGLSAALHLAQRGVDVAVLEAHEPDLIACAEGLGVSPAAIVAAHGALDA